jgi:hypothetical protein
MIMPHSIDYHFSKEELIKVLMEMSLPDQYKFIKEHAMWLDSLKYNKNHPQEYKIRLYKMLFSGFFWYFRNGAVPGGFSESELNLLKAYTLRMVQKNIFKTKALKSFE